MNTPGTPAVPAVPAVQQDVTVTLTVSAKTLYDLKNPTQDEIDKLCLLSDDHKGEYTQNQYDPKHFVSEVYKEYKVKWTGASTNKGYSVEITNYVHKAGLPDSVQVINDTTKTSQGTPKFKQIIGEVNKVTPNPQSEAELDCYNIYFEVYDLSGNKPGKAFYVDPKLKGNP